MEVRLDGTAQALRSPFPWLAFAAALLLTAATWFALERNRLEDYRQLFERRTESVAEALRGRVAIYEQILRSAAAYIASDEDGVSRREWRAFVAGQQLGERFPGIHAVGFAEYLTPATVAAHLKRLRDEMPSYEVRPAGDPPERVVVVYSEPNAGRNARLVGYDLYSDGVGRGAVDKARDSGEVAITGRMSILGESAQGEATASAGFLMFAPVFQQGVRGLPREQRRTAVSGYVFAPIRMQELMQALYDQGLLRYVEVRIHDAAAEGVALQREMIDTRRVWEKRASPEPALFERVVHFPMPGRAWTLQFASSPEFDAAARSQRPWIVLAGGGLAAVVVLLLTTALVEAWNRSHGLSMRDPLTGLHNRRYHDETMPRELARARRAGKPVGVIAIDLDNFKQLNDTYGHLVGDHVLAQVGEVLRNATRGEDMACRFGGDEFAVLLPGATLEVARERAEAIRAAVEQLKFYYDNLAIGPFTVSAGVASISPDAQDLKGALRQADRALYLAKESGRNRVATAAEL